MSSRLMKNTTRSRSVTKVRPWRNRCSIGSPATCGSFTTKRVPASKAAPIKGLEAATDPVAFAALCGMIHVVSLAFTRGGTSKMVVATYQDSNDNEGTDTISYKYMTVLETGNNATNGYFLDKPAIAVDINRGANLNPCAHNIYVSYTTFNGLTKDTGKFQSKVTFAKSTDNGLTFSTSKLNQPFNLAFAWHHAGSKVYCGRKLA